jgi:hypothetical protein
MKIGVVSMRTNIRRIVVATAMVALLQGTLAAAPDFEALGRATVSELADGAFDKVVARFDAKMTAGLPREKLAATWEAVVGQVGAYKAVTSVRIQDLPAQAAHVAVLSTEFEKTSIYIQIAFNDEGKISGLYFLPVKPQAQ